MQLMVLSHNNKIDNNKAKLNMLAVKLLEETHEAIQAIEEDDKEHIAEEALDTLQVAIAIIDKLSDKINIEKAIKGHNKKLKSRGWKAKRQIVFKIFNSWE